MGLTKHLCAGNYLELEQAHGSEELMHPVLVSIILSDQDCASETDNPECTDIEQGCSGHEEATGVSVASHPLQDQNLPQSVPSNLHFLYVLDRIACVRLDKKSYISVCQTGSFAQFFGCFERHDCS